MIDCLLYMTTPQEGWREPPIVVVVLILLSITCIWPAWVGHGEDR